MRLLRSSIPPARTQSPAERPGSLPPTGGTWPTKAAGKKAAKDKTETKGSETEKQSRKLKTTNPHATNSQKKPEKRSCDGNTRAR